MTIDRTSAVSTLKEGVANKIHADWQAGFRAKKGDLEPRFKPVKAKYFDWVVANKALFQSLLNAGQAKIEIDIAHVDNSNLDPGNAGENNAAAEGALAVALDAFVNEKDLKSEVVIDELSSLVHDQWMARNGSWASPEQMVPFSQLSGEEQEKDRVIVRHAIAAVTEHFSSKVTA